MTLEEENIIPSEFPIGNDHGLDLSQIKSIAETSIIYVLTRQQDTSSILSKVGSSKVSAQSRAQNYTDGGWVVYHEILVPSVLQFLVEHFAHRILKDKGFWLDPKITNGSASEVFLCEPTIAKEAVDISWENIRISLAEQIGFPSEIVQSLLNENTVSQSIEEFKSKNASILSRIRIEHETKLKEQLSELKQKTEKVLAEQKEQLLKAEEKFQNNKEHYENEISKLQNEIDRLLEVRNRYDAKLIEYEKKQSGEYLRYKNNIEKKRNELAVKNKIISGFDQSNLKIVAFEKILSEFRKNTNMLQSVDKLSGKKVDQKSKQTFIENYEKMNQFISILRSIVSKTNI